MTRAPGLARSLFPLTVAESTVASAYASMDAGDSPAATLVRALAHSPLWGDMAAARIVLRAGKEHLIGLVGSFSETDVARLNALRSQLEQVLPRLRYRDWSSVELDVERLAERLVTSIGWDAIRRSCFVPIPRGGHFVLGMLAYALGLEHRQLQRPPEAFAPVVVVDDCALTGVRFKTFVQQESYENVAFAHLYSHPDLRSAIAREGHECVSAYDLHDIVSEREGDGAEAWRARWKEHGNPLALWTGQPEHVCFPWSEPDVGFWNPVIRREETGWRFVPPERCLKNRSGRPPVPVQVQRPGAGQLQAAPRILHWDEEERTVVADLETRECHQLNHTASLMWRALLGQGTLEGAAETLKDRLAVNPAELQEDVASFRSQLMHRGWLVGSA